jgi:hypothetical protein
MFEQIRHDQQIKFRKKEKNIATPGIELETNHLGDRKLMV